MEYKRQYNLTEIKDVITKLRTQSYLQEEKFFRHILLVSSSILGIVAALHDTQDQCLYIRLVFVLSVVLLGLGTLIVGIVVYNHTAHYSRMEKKAESQIGSSQYGDELPFSFLLPKNKNVVLLEKVSLMTLFLGFFLLVIYVVLSSLYI